MQTSTRPRMDATHRTKLGKICSFVYAGGLFWPGQICFHSAARQVDSAYQVVDFESWKFDFGSD